MSDKKVIVELITGLGIGGAEKMLYNFLLHIDRIQFEPIVIALLGGELKEKIESLGIQVYVINMKRGKVNIFNFITLIKIIHKIRPQLIHGWMYHGNIMALFSSIFNYHRIPCLWSIHCSVDSLTTEKKKTKFIVGLGAYFSKFPNLIHYVSNTGARQHDEIGYHNKKTVVIPNAFDTDAFRYNDSTVNKLKTELAIEKETVLVGLIGRYNPVKNHENFLTAASLLLKKSEKVHFILVGKGIDSSNKILREKIGHLELTNRVHLLGERQDISDITSSLDIACSASNSEGFSMAIGEAMCCEVPCVVTDVGDSKFIVGDTGKIVPPKDPIAFANALMELIDLGHNGRKSLGAAARNRIIEKFSIKSIMSEFEELYRCTINK